MAKTVGQLADGLARDYHDRRLIHPELRSTVFRQLNRAAKYAEEPTVASESYLAPGGGWLVSREERRELERRFRSLTAQLDAIFERFRRVTETDGGGEET